MSDWDDSLGLDWRPTPSPAPTSRRLTRSREQRVVFGVCGGVAEYFQLDPIIVRLATVVLTITTGWFLAAYLIASCAIPLARVGGEYAYDSPRRPRFTRAKAGWLLIGVGAVVLLNRLHVDIALIMAATLVVIGINMVVRHRK
jgi:phage shock protein PspC (stress-responsive transcriptional regulator)